MIREDHWKNKPCLILENSVLRLAVLPDLGAKIASLMYRPVSRGSGPLELAAQSGGPYGDPPPGADFSRYDASGIDDVFPSVTASTQMVNGRPVEYPDHGEIWTGHFSAERSAGDAVDLTFRSGILPYEYHKNVSLKDNRIKLAYSITNSGDYEFPCIWLFHGLFRYEEDMVLIYPPDTETLVNVYSGATLGPVGRRYRMNGGEYDFSSIPQKDTLSAVKYYVEGPLKSGVSGTGVCGYYYPQSGVQVLLTFDETALPYLGFWVTAGGFRGDYNCAFEPSNGFYDDIATARQNRALPGLAPGQTLNFSVSIDIKELKETA